MITLNKSKKEVFSNPNGRSENWNFRKRENLLLGFPGDLFKDSFIEVWEEMGLIQTEANSRRRSMIRPMDLCYVIIK